MCVCHLENILTYPAESDTIEILLRFDARKIGSYWWAKGCIGPRGFMFLEDVIEKSVVDRF